MPARLTAWRPEAFLGLTLNPGIAAPGLMFIVRWH
jgi:hypothetical protein